MAAVTPQQVRQIYIENFDRVPTAAEFKHHKDHNTPYGTLKSWAEKHPTNVKIIAKKQAEAEKVRLAKQAEETRKAQAAQQAKQARAQQQAHQRAKEEQARQTQIKAEQARQEQTRQAKIKAEEVKQTQIKAEQVRQAQAQQKAEEAKQAQIKLQVRQIYLDNFDRVPTTAEFKHHADKATPINELKSWAETHPQNIKIIAQQKAEETKQAQIKVEEAKVKAEQARQTETSTTVETIGSASSSPTTPATPQANGIASPSDIRRIYVENFDRVPEAWEFEHHKTKSTTVGELDTWAKEKASTTPIEELSKKPEAPVQETEQTDGEKEARAALDEFLEEWDGTTEEKALLNVIFDEAEYTSGQTVLKDDQLEEIIKNAAETAEADLQPYYERITGQTIEDLKRNMEDIRTDTSQYLARENIDYKKKVQQTKDSLRQRGLTFSGIGRKQLGAKGFIDTKDEWMAEKDRVKGEIPEERRLDVAAGLDPFERGARDTALQGERTLGTKDYSALSLDPRVTTPYNTNRALIKTVPISSTDATGGIINEPGTIPSEKLTEKAKLQAEKVGRSRLFI